MNFYYLKNKYGFSLVEVLVSLLIIMILTLGVYSLIITYLKLTTDNQMMIEATALANQKMERIRNLSYSDVGTTGGSPTGVIADTETVSRGSGGTFTVNTLIVYYDDSYDGTEASSTDTICDDYKIATIEVAWKSKYGAKSIRIFSKIIPATEETDSGNGLIKLFVVDANGNPLEGANIHIENNLLLPVYNPIDRTSGVSGELVYSVLPSLEGYEITVTKFGYGIDRTYDRDAINLNPTKPHLSVVAGAKTEESFSIDLLSLLQLHTVQADLPENWQANDDSSGENQVNARIAIDNSGYIYIVWEDYRQSSQSKIFAQKYNNDGDPQWPNPATPADVNITTANNTVLPDIAVDLNGNLYMTWHDDSVGNKEAYIDKRRSSNGTAIWGSANNINTIADSDNQIFPRLTLNDNGTYATTTVVWMDDRNSDWDLYVQVVAEDGTRILTPEIRVNNTALPDGFNQYDPCLVSDNANNVYIAWTDERNGEADIYATQFINDSSFGWQLKMDDDSSGADQYQADIAMDSLGFIYIIWTDERNGDSDIYAQKYNAGSGAPIWGADIRINTDSESIAQYEPSIAIDTADNIYIAWTDERNGDQDIYAQKYDTDGNSLWAVDLRININNDNSAQYNPDVYIDTTTSPDTPYATWQDDRCGDLDVYVSSFEFYTITSYIPDVDLEVTGTKRIGENPIIYEYDIAASTDSGGNRDLIVEWDAPGYTINATSSPWTVIYSEPAQPIEILPGETIDVYLFVEN